MSLRSAFGFRFTLGTRIALGWALVVPLATVGCLPDPTVEPADGNTAMSADQLMVKDGVAYRATRRYSDFYGTVKETHTERVVLAADGRWRVDLLELNGMTKAELESAQDQEQSRIFDAMQLGFEGGRGKYAVASRDFRMRDPALFKAAYDFDIISENASVAGRQAYLADVWPLAPDRPRYTVWVDHETLVTLKSLEYVPSGELASEMEVLEIEFDPDLGGESLHLDPVKTSLTAGQVLQVATFAVRQPQYVPPGFALLAVQHGALDAHDVFTWSLSDGLQEIFLAEYAAIDAPADAPEGYPALAPPVVRVTFYGPQANAAFEIGGTQIHLQAKLDQGEMAGMIESMVPVGP